MRLSVMLAVVLVMNLPVAGVAATTSPVHDEIVKKAGQANVAYGAKNYKEAASLYTEAINAAAKSKDLDRERAILLTNLGAVYRVDKKNDLAIETYKKSLELKRKVLGDKDPSTTDTMEHLVVALQAGGKSDEAKKIELEMVSDKVLPDVSTFILPAKEHRTELHDHGASSHYEAGNVSAQQPKQVTQSIRQIFVMSTEDRYKLHNPQYEEHEKVSYDPNSVVYVGGIFGFDQAPPAPSQINSSNSVPVYKKETVKVPIPQRFEYQEQVHQLHGRHPYVSEASMKAALEDGSTLMELGNSWLIKISQQLDPTYWHGGTRVIVTPQLSDRYQVNIQNPVARTLVQGQFMGR